MLRRNFLGGLLAAPAIVKASSLMPIWTPKWHRGGVLESGVVYFNGCAVGKTTCVTIERNEVFDEFTLAQIRLVAASIGVQSDRLIFSKPDMQTHYSSARIALLEQFPKPRPSGQWAQGQSRPFPS